MSFNNFLEQFLALNLPHKIMFFTSTLSFVTFVFTCTRKGITPLTIFANAIKINNFSLSRFFAIITSYSGVGSLAIIPAVLIQYGRNGLFVFTVFFLICATLKLYEAHLAAVNQDSNLTSIINLNGTFFWEIMKQIVYFLIIALCFDMSIIFHIFNNASKCINGIGIEECDQNQKIAVLICMVAFIVVYSLSYASISFLNMIFFAILFGLIVYSSILNTSITGIMQFKKIDLLGVIKCAFCAHYLTDCYSFYTFFDTYHYRLYETEKKASYEEGKNATALGLLYSYVFTILCTSACLDCGVQDTFTAVYKSLAVSKVLIYTVFTLFTCSSFFTYTSCIKVLFHSIFGSRQLAQIVQISLVVAFFVMVLFFTRDSALMYTYSFSSLIQIVGGAIMLNQALK